LGHILVVETNTCLHLLADNQNWSLIHPRRAF